MPVRRCAARRGELTLNNKGGSFPFWGPSGSVWQYDNLHMRKYLRTCRVGHKTSSLHKTGSPRVFRAKTQMSEVTKCVCFKSGTIKTQHFS